jgi:hypothetical protein
MNDAVLQDLVLRRDDTATGLQIPYRGATLMIPCLLVVFVLCLGFEPSLGKSFWGRVVDFFASRPAGRDDRWVNLGIVVLFKA